MDDKEQPQKYLFPIAPQPDNVANLGGMKIGRFNITPILLYIPDTEYYSNRFVKAREHFKEAGLYNIIEIPGTHARTLGIRGTHPYTLDDPSGNYFIGDGYVSEFVNMYMLYNIMSVLPGNIFMKLECDTKLIPDYLFHLERELEHVPDDFDFVHLGSCCIGDKAKNHIGGNVFKFDSTTGFGQCGHNYLINKKCLAHVISTQRDAFAPSDINLLLNTFPALHVYGVHPRIADQFENNLPI